MGKHKEYIEQLKETFLILDDVIPTIDKIGSGFEDTEQTALALLLYFKEGKILDELAKIRKIVSLNLKSELSETDYDEFIEQDVCIWKPPYDKNKGELLKMLNED
jgi:hypothetical protein